MSQEAEHQTVRSFRHVAVVAVVHAIDSHVYKVAMIAFARIDEHLRELGIRNTEFHEKVREFRRIIERIPRCLRIVAKAQYVAYPSVARSELT